MLPLSGCSDRFLAGPLHYVENDALTKELKGKTNLAGKPELQDKVRKAPGQALRRIPKQIKVPEGMGALLTGGGALPGELLSSVRARASSRIDRVTRRLGQDQITGGYGLYRRNCLHCHGVSGAGDGPTARRSSIPTPRDYRKGIFKFTSTPNGARPHRDDLRRTITNGLHGTSMPAFESLLTDGRDRAGHRLRDLPEHARRDRAGADRGRRRSPTRTTRTPCRTRSSRTSPNGVFNKWKLAQTQVVNPPTPRTPSSRESILRGRELFLGRTTEKLECAGCHGRSRMGDGPSFVQPGRLQRGGLRRQPQRAPGPARRSSTTRPRDLWNQKPDDWGNPLRPANLNRGVYKGGRRPLDLYWRIAKGINGAQMPAHYPTHQRQEDLGPGQLRAGTALRARAARETRPPAARGRRRP